MKQNPLLSAVIVFPAALATTSEGFLAGKLAGFQGNTVAVEKLLEQCPVEGTWESSPPPRLVDGQESSSQRHLNAKTQIYTRLVIKVRASERRTQNHF